MNAIISISPQRRVHLWSCFLLVLSAVFAGATIYSGFTGNIPGMAMSALAGLVCVNSVVQLLCLSAFHCDG